jgi:hypothetical protein
VLPAGCTADDLCPKAPAIHSSACPHHPTLASQPRARQEVRTDILTAKASLAANSTDRTRLCRPKPANRWLLRSHRRGESPQVQKRRRTPLSENQSRHRGFSVNRSCPARGSQSSQTHLQSRTGPHRQADTAGIFSHEGDLTARERDCKSRPADFAQGSHACCRATRARLSAIDARCRQLNQNAYVNRFPSKMRSAWDQALNLAISPFSR